MNDQNSDQRSQPRYHLSGPLPGIWLSQDGQPLEILPVDVSKIGLGLLIDPAPRAGDIIIWQTQHPNESFEFKVIWTITPREASLPNMESLRRCGLVLQTPRGDLLEVCSNFLRGSENEP